MVVEGRGMGGCVHWHGTLELKSEHIIVHEHISWLRPSVNIL